MRPSNWNRRHGLGFQDARRRDDGLGCFRPDRRHCLLRDRLPTRRSEQVELSRVGKLRTLPRAGRNFSAVCRLWVLGTVVRVLGCLLLGSDGGSPAYLGLHGAVYLLLGSAVSGASGQSLSPLLGIGNAPVQWLVPFLVMAAAMLSWVAIFRSWPGDVALGASRPHRSRFRQSSVGS